MSKKMIIGVSSVVLVASMVGIAGLAVAKHRAHHGGPHGGKFFMLKKADTNKDGVITKEELQAAQEKRFKKFDLNDDGEVTAKEVQEKMSEHFAKRAQRLTRRFDENRDGKVTAEEFKAHGERRLYMLDLNNDGQISKDEMPRRFSHHRGHRKHHGRHHGKYCERMNGPDKADRGSYGDEGPDKPQE